jgi:hypothetical protein
MAGRCISVTHEALGTVRVMKTCGMMGEVVGKAASVAVKHGTTPRGVYENHWAEMDELLKLGINRGSRPWISRPCRSKWCGGICPRRRRSAGSRRPWRVAGMWSG